jgi:mannitol-1-phosphate/altronate dehydrogenase
MNSQRLFGFTYPTLKTPSIVQFGLGNTSRAGHPAIMYKQVASQSNTDVSFAGFNAKRQRKEKKEIKS